LLIFILPLSQWILPKTKFNKHIHNVFYGVPKALPENIDEAVENFPLLDLGAEWDSLENSASSRMENNDFEKIFLSAFG
jgi:hypothetical protein